MILHNTATHNTAEPHTIQPIHSQEQHSFNHANPMNYDSKNM